MAFTTTTNPNSGKPAEAGAASASKADKDDDRSLKRGGGFHRKKVCRFCSDQDFHLDYKDVRMMQSFVTEHGKIVPRRISGNCAQHQRKLTTCLKRARNLALVGYVTVGV
jgi:small subunit ribosomal protein S18